MENKALISVVIPVYNVEEYISRCISSILEQTYRNLQIILVDDGSTDKSGEICDEYAKADRRVTVIHQTNGGVSSARNTGIDKATGEYITFVDSDDFVSKEMVAYLFALAKNNDCDIAISTHNIIRGEKVWKSYNLSGDVKMTPKRCIEKLLYDDGVDTSAWAKLYKLKLFNGVRYPVGKLYEDIATTYKIFLKANAIISGNNCIYNYVLRSNSIVNGEFNEKKFDLIEMTDEMVKAVCEVYPDLSNAGLRRRVYARFSTLNQLIGVDGYASERAAIIRFIKSNALKLLCDGKVPKRDKVALLLLLFNYNCYLKIWSIVKK